jgi:YVTN family beta-propeller protein
MVTDCSNNVSVIDTATYAVIATVPVGKWPVAFGKFIGGESAAQIPAMEIPSSEEKASLSVAQKDKNTETATSGLEDFMIKNPTIISNVHNQ